MQESQILKIIFNAASDCMLLVDPDTRKLHLGNKRIPEKLGYDLEEIKKLKIDDLHPKDTLPYVLGQFDKLTKKEITVSEHIPIKKKNDSIFYADMTASHLQLQDEVYLLVIIRDVTKRKTPEKKAEDEESKIRTIFDETFQFIGLMTTGGVLIEANKAALEFSGVEASSVLNKPFWETPWWTHSKEMQEKLKDAVKKAAQGQFIRFEATHKAKDGSLHTIDFSLKPVRDKSGKVIFLIPEGRDITKLKTGSE